MEKFNRFKNAVDLGKQAEVLRTNPVFLEAVEAVLNDYAQLEEKVLTDDQSEVREITARIKHYAMMRRALLDAVEKLNDFVLVAENAKFDEDT